MLKKCLAILLTLAISLSSIWACTGGNGNTGNTDDPGETPEATPVFNEGIVDYNMTVTSGYDPEFDMGLLGTVVTKKTPGTSRNYYVSSVGDEVLKKVSTIDSGDCAQSQLQIGVTLDGNSDDAMDVICFGKKSQTSFDGNGVLLKFNGKKKVLSYQVGNGKSTEVSTGGAEGSVIFQIICTYEKNVIIYLNGTYVVTISAAEVVDGETLTSYYYSIIPKEGTKMEKISMFKSGKNIVTKDVTATPVGDNKLGLDITDKQDLVGICYTMWFNAYLGNGDDEIVYNHNVSDLLKEYKFTSSKGFVNDQGKTANAENYYHYWGTPAQGYYRSTDKTAHRNNMNLLYKAGVDFIVCDYTFATYDGGFIPGTSSWNTYIGGPLTALLDTIMEMRAEGLGTPYVVLWPNSQRLFDALYENFIGVEKYKDCFVYWNEKPFILTWIYQTYTGDQFETRGMYGLQGKVTSNQWSYLEVDNKQTVAYDDNGNPEHMTACVATQRTYMTNFDTACGRDGGNFWYNQWKNVFEVHPKITTITWWNEWGAILFHQNGQWFFTDNFNQEYSRDIEPMEGGHGDQYYRWLCEYVKAYKAHEECPKLTEY